MREATKKTTPSGRRSKVSPVELDACIRVLKVSTGPREMELIGVDEEGRMSLWDTGLVQPVSAFTTTEGGQYIESGHYVIEWKGHAITVHCGNRTDGTVSVLFMCSGGGGLSMQRAEVEPLLLGKVIPDPVKAAEITRLLEGLVESLAARRQAPHLRRGRI